MRVIDGKLDLKTMARWGWDRSLPRTHIHGDLLPEKRQVRTGSGRNCNFIGIEVMAVNQDWLQTYSVLKLQLSICSHQKFRCTLLLSCTIFCHSHMLCTVKRIWSTFYECLVLIASISNNSGSTHPFIVRTYDFQDVRQSSAIFG